jgi:uncharacterized protein (TIGR00297 family)
MHFIIASILAAFIAGAAYKARALSGSGAAAAVVVGTVVFGFGGWAFAVPLLTFFITSTLLSRWRRRHKEALGYEKGGRRDGGQVLANGGVAALCALAYGMLNGSLSTHAYTLYLAALAAANADTWATEIGSAIGGRPVSILTFRRVPVGTSGGVSAAGTAGLVAGAFAIAVFQSLFRPAHTAAASLLAPLIGGVAGALIDSVLGATIQAQWADPADPDRLVERRPAGAASPVRGLSLVGNDCVNFLATASAAAVAWFLC